MKALLTSCGFETDAIQRKFLEYIGGDASKIKALFIPTAAIDADAIEVLPKCMDDLLKCQVKRENIAVYDLHKAMPLEELKQYDAVYICGGNTEYLRARIHEQGFYQVLLQYIREGGVAVGVSAGSLIFTSNRDASMNLIPWDLRVHCSENDCETPGYLDAELKECVKLGNLQAIAFDGDKPFIIGS